MPSSTPRLPRPYPDMKSNSRTAKSIKNSVVAMSFYIVNLALQFFSRKVFLD